MIRTTEEYPGINPGRHSHYKAARVPTCDIAAIVVATREHHADDDEPAPVEAVEVSVLDCAVVEDAETGEMCVMLTVEDDGGEVDRLAFGVAEARQLRAELDACLDAIDDEKCEGA